MPRFDNVMNYPDGSFVETIVTDDHVYDVYVLNGAYVCCRYGNEWEAMMSMTIGHCLREAMADVKPYRLIVQSLLDHGVMTYRSTDATES